MNIGSAIAFDTAEREYNDAWNAPSNTPLFSPWRSKRVAPLMILILSIDQNEIKSIQSELPRRLSKGWLHRMTAIGTKRHFAAVPECRRDRR